MARSSIQKVYRVDIATFHSRMRRSMSCRHALAGNGGPRPCAATTLTHVTVTSGRGSPQPRVERRDVCDAHPELLRAARNVGKASRQACPICESTGLVEVTYVFGSRLPPGGLCPGTKAELQRLRRRGEPVLCYDVEVCVECAWHHLIRKYPGGGTIRRSAAFGRS